MRKAINDMAYAAGIYESSSRIGAGDPAAKATAEYITGIIINAQLALKEADAAAAAKRQNPVDTGGGNG